jgi:fimbrial isopeptide formation D2 family protein/LPXTG-motif cell wall-anchored protein
MKKLNKMLSMLLAVIMVLSMSVVAMAGGGYTITINGSQKGHTYSAYQIFSGNLSETGELTEIAWGSGVSEAGKTALGTDATTVASELTEANVDDFAKKVAPYVTTVAGSITATDDGAQITGLATGYYLIKDTESLNNKENAAYTSYILKVAGNDVTVDTKTDVPTLVKKVADDITDVKTLTNDDDAWQDSADYSEGDTVPFKLTATLPNNVSDYTKYTLKFNDTLSTGLTFDGDSSVAVTVVDKNNGTYNLTADDYSVNSDGTALTFTIDDLKAIQSLNGVTLDEAKVIVRYTATLNENAVIGYVGNPNTANLEYSNNPNYTGTGSSSSDGTPEDTTPGGKDDDSTGTTTDDKVIVFTYELDITKLDGAAETKGKELPGVTFALYTKAEYEKGESGTPIDTITNNDNGQFAFERIDAGEYVLVEENTPIGYNKISPIEFKITATHSDEAVEPVLISLKVDNDSFTVETDNNDKYTGAITTEITNNVGPSLPSTGGMGTRVIYLIGGALVLAASVLLVTKRRMRNSK